jgi:peptidylprolyl isomerase/peptidyl-prolyl cis-trans isomerase B (cyclophilin B)
VAKRPAVYVVECCDGSLYTGATVDLARRIAAHRLGKGAKFTRSRLPLRLVAWWYAPDYGTACGQEARFKALGRRAKLSLLAASEAFGAHVHKAPSLHERRPEVTPMPHTPPQPSELEAYSSRASDSQARIKTPHGDIVFTFFADDAPLHVASFIKLAEAGFYDGLVFHRVEPGFVVQGGDPDGNGTGGPGYNLKAEFSARPHLRGTVAMARSSDPNSAGSQFYICLDDAKFLDGQYTVFGQMTGGFEALDAIRPGSKMDAVSIEPKAKA